MRKDKDIMSLILFSKRSIAFPGMQESLSDDQLEKLTHSETNKTITYNGNKNLYYNVVI